MIYLEKFKLLTGDRCREAVASVQEYETHDEDYPAYLFCKMEFGCIDFEDITIFYGGNGSGKTSLLNVISEKLQIYRKNQYIQTEFFKVFLEKCTYQINEIYGIPKFSKFLASDDVFEHILTMRSKNKSLKNNKVKESDFHSVVKYSFYQDIFPGGVKLDFEGNYKDVHQKLSRFNEARKKTRRQYVRSRAGEMQRQYSNGENALMFFEKQIGEKALYLLDEPENSLSPKFQMELKYMIENSVRYQNCQFIIATHSPFMLSLFGAKIYNLDVSPVTVARWHELENVRIFYDFFKMNKEYFE